MSGLFELVLKILSLAVIPLLALFITSSLLLFGTDDIAISLGLSGFVKDNRSSIGAVWLVSGSLLLGSFPRAGL